MAKTTWNKVDSLVNGTMAAGLESLGNDVKKRAIILAPKDTGRLRQSAKVTLSQTKDEVIISFNTPYARRRHYENKLHPATLKYLTNAMKSIRDVKRYFTSFN